MIEVVIVKFGAGIKLESASFNRTRSLFSGLSKLGIRVSVFTSKIDRDIHMVNDINIILSQQKNRNNVFKDYFSLIKYIKEISKGKTMFLQLPTNHNFLNIFAIKALRKYNVSFFHERSEYPFLGINKKSLQGVYLMFDYFLYIKIILPKLSFMIIMTNSLITFFSKYYKKDILHIPMTVDVSRFSNLDVNDKYANSFMYCGSLNCKKDGVDILIKAFNIVAEKYNDFRLVLVGSFTKIDDEKVRIENLILSSPFKKRIDVIGKVKRDDIPLFLASSFALCLSRPESKQAEGGFPTKLGEYLAASRPVIITNTGTISDYLTNQSAYIANPGSVSDFANSMITVINDSNREKIAKKGYEICDEFFSDMKYKKIIAKYLKDFHG